MADITVRLIWYKLGESSSKMAEAAATWYSKLRWEDHVLDILLMGWLCWCSVIVIVINSFTSFVGPLQRRQPSETLRVKETGSKPIASKGGGVETCQWFNTAINWCYLHYYHSAEFLDEWIKSLNEQINKLGGPVQTKFERIQAGSLPPKFTDVSCEATPEDKFVIHVRVDSRDLAFVIFCSQQTHEGVKLTNCTATVFRLRGTLLVKAFKEAGEVKVTVGFDGRPDIKVNVKPANPYQAEDDPADMVDIGIVEESVRQAICMTTTTFIITHLLTPDDRGQGKGHSGHDRGTGQGQGPNLNQGYSHMPQMNEGNFERRMPQTHGSQPMQSMHVQSTQLQSTPKRKPAPQPPATSSPATQGLPQNEALFVPIEADKYQSAFQTPVTSAADIPPKPPRFVGDKRLLVKVIKANGVGAKEIGSVDPVILLLMDDPIQNHSTSVVRNTSNPFWDESFLFDVTKNSNELRFEVFDKTRQPGEDFLGETTVYVEDLRRTPSSRQILALQARPGHADSISGSLTVEFLYMDSAEAEMMIGMSGLSNNQLSPKRRIETERTITPGDHGTGVPEPVVPHIKTIESSPTEESGTIRPVSSATTETGHVEKEKKKSSFGDAIRKRFGRKKRSQSADRAASSLKEGANYLRPPEQSYGPQSKDDLELVRSQEPPKSPNLKKSRSLGGSLKKLFRRGRKRSKSRGETSRESSFSRSSGRQAASQNPSRDSSLNRHSAHQRSASTS